MFFYRNGITHPAEKLTFLCHLRTRNLTFVCRCEIMSHIYVVFLQILDKLVPFWCLCHWDCHPHLLFIEEKSGTLWSLTDCGQKYPPLLYSILFTFAALAILADLMPTLWLKPGSRIMLFIRYPLTGIFLLRGSAPARVISGFALFVMVESLSKVVINYSWRKPPLLEPEGFLVSCFITRRCLVCSWHIQVARLPLWGVHNLVSASDMISIDDPTWFQ